MKLTGSRRGISALEVVVVVLICAIITAVVLPVLARSKKQAYRANDLSNLHQLGIAAALYQQDAGEWPASVDNLVASELVPREIVASSLDGSALGLANLLAEGWKRFNPSIEVGLPYKCSYIGWREYRVSVKERERWILPGVASGWLVDLTPTDPGYDPVLSDRKGRFRRLTFEGSVINRPIQMLDCSDHGQSAPCFMAVTMFVDPDPELRTWAKSLK